MATTAFRTFTGLSITHNKGEIPIGYIVETIEPSLTSNLGSSFVIGLNSPHKVDGNGDTAYMEVVTESEYSTSFKLYVYTTYTRANSFYNGAKIAPLFASDLGISPPSYTPSEPGPYA